jgi:tetratricopeptide (TPR) repeat protein
MSDSLLVKFLSHSEQSSSSFSLSYNNSSQSRVFSFSYSSTRLLLLVVFSLLFLEGCAGRISHYDKLSASLGQGNSEEAAEIIAKAESRYGSKSRLLYLMDRGMTLHLAGQYNESTKYLEQADELVEDLYTRRLRNEALSLLINDSKRAFRGDPYEQVMINVVNALNYARLGEDYQEDPFARYLTGVLYEANGDESNAFVAYRKAYEAYQQAQSWSEVPIPEGVKRDLLRITDRLNLSNEHAAYQEAFPEISWESSSNNQGEIIIVSYHVGPGVAHEAIWGAWSTRCEWGGAGFVWPTRGYCENRPSPSCTEEDACE